MLRRNRDFALLQGGQLLSAAGSESTAIAYPLLVLAVTHSPARAGLVGFARILPFALFGLPAGVAADRYDRRRVMIAADGVRALAVGALGVSIAAGAVAFWQVPLVAFVEGAGSAFFAPAAAGALRSVVPVGELPAAAGVQQARAASVNIAGPPVGGALFGLGHAVPFLADAGSYTFSVASLLAMRTPFQEKRARERPRLLEGLRFLWAQPFLRTAALLYAPTNLIGPGVLLSIVVIGTAQRLPSGRIGLLLAAFGACVLLGALASPLVRRALPARAILVLELWTWPGCALFVIWPDVYVLAASILPTALAIPSTDSVVIARRLAVTPDRLVGRVESVRTTISLAIAPLGPLAAGALLDTVSARATIGVFAAMALVLAVCGTLSPALKT